MRKAGECWKSSFSPASVFNSILRGILDTGKTTNGKSLLINLCDLLHSTKSFLYNDKFDRTVVGSERANCQFQQRNALFSRIT